MSRSGQQPDASARRNFLKGVGAAGVALTGAAIVGGNLAFPRNSVKAAGLSDVDILNFALNLEYLEAEFYAVAVTGKTLLQLGVLTAAEQLAPTTGGSKVTQLATSDQAYVSETLHNNEIDHVLLLRSALGSYAAPKPAINLDALGYGFNGAVDFTKLSRQLEDVGTSAYLGAAPDITSKAYLATAGSILADEAKHSGALRYICVLYGVDSPAVDSLDIPPSKSSLFGATSQALISPRTPAQVLKIVYGGGTCSGGFYPNGMTGSITCAS
jgi:Ferritin-like domain